MVSCVDLSSQQDRLSDEVGASSDVNDVKDRGLSDFFLANASLKMAVRYNKCLKMLLLKLRIQQLLRLEMLLADSVHYAAIH